MTEHDVIRRRLPSCAGPLATSAGERRQLARMSGMATGASPLPPVFDQAMLAAVDMAADGCWSLVVSALEQALHEARLKATESVADTAGVARGR